MRNQTHDAARTVAATTLRVMAALATMLGWVSAAEAHEPLWGETPSIFGPRVFHPEVRIGVTRHRGASSREIEQEYGMQYGINRFVNARLVLPAVRMDVQDGGAPGATRVSGIDDALLSLKYRFRLRQDTGFQASQALIVGWKLPTGDDDERDLSGARITASDQPGSGRHGIEVGYAAGRERLVDSIWTSAFYTHEIGDGFRRGDTFEVNAAYGRWVVRPNVAENLGVNLAAGVHAMAMADDRLDGDVSSGNGHRVAGLQVTPIVTKGRSQYRLGVFVPLLKSGNEEELNFDYQVRFGWEMFF